MNKSLFKKKVVVPQYDTVNEAGGLAFKHSDQEALAQLAVTGTFNDVFYATGEQKLDELLELAMRVEAGYLARVAIYAAENGLMKDAPAVLLAALAVRSDSSKATIRQVFNRVIRTGKMLSNLVAVHRSGVLGRTSIPRVIRRCIRDWLTNNEPGYNWRTNIGVTDPDLGDIIKMVHPRGAVTGTPQWAVNELLLGRDVENLNMLPENVAAFEHFKRERNAGRGQDLPVPNVPFRALTALNLTDKDWAQIAMDAPWQMTRMNLNTFARHNVFASQERTQVIADRLRNPELVRKSKVMPYQLLTAFQNITADVPRKVREALQDAMEIATENVPVIEGKTAIVVDVSGSMGSSVTGYRQGATSTTTCLDVAALVAACLFRSCPDSKIIPVDTSVHQFSGNSRDSVMTLSRQLGAFRGGGTALGAAFNAIDRDTKNVIIVSDNMSWADSWYGNGETVAQGFQRLNRNARMVCIDIQPYASSPGNTGARVLNVGGFSDSVFTVMDLFLNDKGGWVDLINSITLD